MNKKSIIITSVILFISSCNKNADTFIISEKPKAISPALYEAIITNITYFDSIAVASRTKYTPPVYEIELFNENDTCYISIISSDFFTDSFEGFLEIKDEIIAFRNPRNDCNQGIISTNKLLTDSKKYYENSVDNDFILEPLERKYRIVNKDSLEFVSFDFR